MTALLRVCVCTAVAASQVVTVEPNRRRSWMPVCLFPSLRRMDPGVKRSAERANQDRERGARPSVEELHEGMGEDEDT